MWEYLQRIDHIIGSNLSTESKCLLYTTHRAVQQTGVINATFVQFWTHFLDQLNHLELQNNHFSSSHEKMSHRQVWTVFFVVFPMYVNLSIPFSLWSSRNIGDLCKVKPGQFEKWPLSCLGRQRDRKLCRNGKYYTGKYIWGKDGNVLSWLIWRSQSNKITFICHIIYRFLCNKMSHLENILLLPHLLSSGFVVFRLENENL